MRQNFAVPSAIMVFVCAAQAFAADAAQTLADRLTAQLKRALPGYEITASDPLTLRLTLPDKTNVQVNLDRISDFCAANPPSGCDNEISDFVAKTVVFAKSNMAAPVRREALRAVVRSASYADPLIRMMASNGASLVSEPLAGDVVTLCYFDEPTTMRPATDKDLSAIGLDPSNAMAACKANMKTALPPLDSVLAKQPQGKGGLLAGDPYESSYVISADDWKDLAAKYGGHLLVAVPDAATVIYAQEDGPNDVVRVSNAAKQLEAEAERPISDNVFRWTPSGWRVVTP